MKKPFLPFLQRIIIFSLTVIAIGIIIFAWNDIKKDRIKDLSYTNSVIRRYYELSFNQWRNTLLNLGDRLVQIDGTDQDSVRLSIVNSAIKNYEELSAFGFTNPDGQIVTFSNRELDDSLPNLMESENSKRSFLSARKSPNLSIGEVYYFSEVGDWILPMRVPIRDDSSGELLAVNTTALEYNQINKNLESFGFNEQYRIHLTNDEFEVNQIYYPLSPEEYKNVLRKPAAIYKDLQKKEIAGLKYTSVYSKLEATEMFMISAPLQGLSHTLHVSVNQSIIWEEVLPILLIIVFFYLVFVIGTSVLFRYFQKKQEKFHTMLIESEANLKAIFESTNSVIGLFDINKKLVEFNQSFAKYSLLTDNIVLKKGMDVFPLMQNKDIANVFINFQNRALSGEKFAETIAYPGPESTIYFLLSYNPIIQDDAISGISMFVEDITELKTYETQLEQQAEHLEQTVERRTSQLQAKNKELEAALQDLKEAQNKLVQSEKMASLGVLSAGIGHEINNPLNFIKNGASALLANLENSKVDVKSLTPFFDIIETGVTRANKIVKSLSHFSRDVKTMDEKCNVNVILENCLTIVQNSLKDRIHVKKQFDLNCPTILGNEGKLHQVFLNLLTNAEQAIENEGDILITTGFSAHDIIVTITDSGKGINPEDIDKIADPFFTTKSPGEGTGLGLYITYNIIQEHNGSINVRSVPKNGTTFTIKLALTRP